MLSLIYESFAAPEQSSLDLQALLQQSRENNRSFGITGMLLEEDGWFIQALEGPEPVVESLMSRIARDPRHRHVRILRREIRTERRFPDWAMAQAHINDVEALPLTEYYEAMLTARGRDLAAAAAGASSTTPQVPTESAPTDNHDLVSTHEAA